MANTTFNGPVRSEGGFEQISKAAATGTITTNLDIDTSGNITTTGYVSSYANVSSITSATHSVESTDSGTVYTLNRAGGIVVTLPTAAAGLQYTFIVGTTFTGAGQINTVMPATCSLVLRRSLTQQRLPITIPLSLMLVMMTPLIWVQRHRAGLWAE